MQNLNKYKVNESNESSFSFSVMGNKHFFSSLQLNRTLLWALLRLLKLWHDSRVRSRLQLFIAVLEENESLTKLYNEQWFTSSFWLSKALRAMSSHFWLRVCCLVCHCFIWFVTCPICAETRRQNARCLSKIKTYARRTVHLLQRTFCKRLWQSARAFCSYWWFFVLID